MKLLQYFFGIVIAQIALFSLIMLNADTLTYESVLRIAVPSAIIALVIAFWFASLAKAHSKEELLEAKEEFASEREKIKVNAERAKLKAHKEAQKEILKESTRAHAKANFKVGAAFAGMLGVGALFVMAQMVTAGLLLMAASTGAIGGYYLRSKQDRYKELPVIEVKAIEEQSSLQNSIKKLKNPEK